MLIADKVNKTVIMDKEKYVEKIQFLLSDDNTYQKMDFDPTSRFQAKNNKDILDLFKKGKVDEKNKNFLVTYNGVSPKVYGLPKLHKKDIPLRPITSSINSSFYNLAKYLNYI